MPRAMNPDCIARNMMMTQPSCQVSVRRFARFELLAFVGKSIFHFKTPFCAPEAESTSLEKLDVLVSPTRSADAAFRSN